eukprot:CAMPEP_0172542756 /NCGR_PEP_ID=MMETSP1067-20121228/13303_1 /TAXON_ID=265564 ORGANISM="Thalassiosira punctigera, Strain Tpunct2005C2" /NCGR_SAMPLE_ID=MMETSP1067 /ASSEMBLY_ACC=CAM_ASM_000444 /LENGTH=77 /DNA_ID=CAMNT_0013329049 /DNA_START=567 /DNA_END=796 /DNA_ORIENTATION=+
MEVVISDGIPATAAGPSDIVVPCLRTITSLLLASRQECDTSEIVSVPDAMAMDVLDKSLSALGEGEIVLWGEERWCP